VKRMLTREIPGDDLSNDTNRFVTGVRELFLVGLNDLSMNFVSPSSIVFHSGDS